MDAVCCCFELIDHGQARMVPVSEEHPLLETRHYVAAKQIEMNEASTGDGIQSHYQRLGVVLLGTVMDGDCGVDCACQMLGLPTSREARNQLRQDVSDYLMARVETPWMQNLMVCCHELHGEELLKHRSCGLSSSGLIDLTSDPPVPTHEPASHSKGAEIAAAQDLQLATIPSSAGDTYAEALQWATGVKDEGILAGMAAALPDGVLQEQLQSFNDNKNQIVPAQREKPKLTLHMNLGVASKASQQFDQYLQVIGLDGDHRLPRN